MSSRPGSVLLGFLLFHAFTNYDQSRSGAETEALMVVQQLETPSSSPEEVVGVLNCELIGYGPCRTSGACARRHGRVSVAGSKQQK